MSLPVRPTLLGELLLHSSHVKVFTCTLLTVYLTQCLLTMELVPPNNGPFERYRCMDKCMVLFSYLCILGKLGFFEHLVRFGKDPQENLAIWKVY